MLACGPTDLHTIGLEAVCVLLRYEGWSCRLLGARTSVPALGAAIHATGAGAVVIVSHLNSGRARAVQSLLAADRAGVTVFYAGNAFTSPRSRRNLPGSYLGTRLQEASEIIETGLAETPMRAKRSQGPCPGRRLSERALHPRTRVTLHVSRGRHDGSSNRGPEPSGVPAHLRAG